MRRRVYLLGWPAAHSLSPAMHRAAFSVLGLRWEYEAVEVSPDELGEAVCGLLRIPDTVGANITIPHKVRVIDHLDDLSDTARKLGAVNTVVRDGRGRLIGHNTDARGLSDSVAAWGFPPGVFRAAILGGGGAARAAVAALAGLGAGTVLVLARRPEGAADLPQVAVGTGCGVEVHPWSARGEILSRRLRGAGGEPVLVVNATPVGMWPEADATPLDRETVGVLPESTWVLDLIYRPPVTRLLDMARERGFPVLGGAGMLVGQAVGSLSLWLGRQVGRPAGVAMAAALDDVEGQTC